MHHPNEGTLRYSNLLEPVPNIKCIAEIPVLKRMEPKRSCRSRTKFRPFLFIFFKLKIPEDVCGLKRVRTIWNSKNIRLQMQMSKKFVGFKKIKKKRFWTRNLQRKVSSMAQISLKSKHHINNWTRANTLFATCKYEKLKNLYIIWEFQAKRRPHFKERY